MPPIPNITIIDIGMQKPLKRLKHGIHNEEVIDYLEIKKERYADWVITTAFYSALHFVTYKIFPFEVYNKKGEKELITNIENYANHRDKMKLAKISRHALLKKLVNSKYPLISVEYKKLFEMSMKARYKEYRHSPEDRRKALELAKKIKAFCTGKEPKPQSQ